LSSKYPILQKTISFSKTLLKFNKIALKKRKLTYKCRINIIQKVISGHNIPKEE